MFKALFVRDEGVIVKPLGFNGSVPSYTIHLLPKLEGINVSMVECQGENCYICRVVDWLKENNLFDVVKEKFKAFGTHFNVQKQKVYILPVYHFWNKNWEFKYIKLFENQFISFVDYLELNNLYDIGSPTNEYTLHIIPDRWNFRFNKGSVPFIITDISQLQKDYNNFVYFIANSENFGIKSEPTYINAINYQFGNIIQTLVKELYNK